MESYVFLVRSRVKFTILDALTEKDLSAVMLSKILKRPRPSISRALQDLENLDFVKCTNPEKDRWRFYKITSKGKDALEEARKYQ